jgi:membrane protein insertase Oxa1/YidC/SpoIIIJ
LYLDLVKPDTLTLPGIPLPLPGVFLLLSAIMQFLSGKMMVPVVKSEKKIADKTPSDSDDVAVAAQQQMLYFLPAMTLIFGYQFPSGLVLYWLLFSLVSTVQQYQVTGWGGLQPWISRLGLVKSRP